MKTLKTGLYSRFFGGRIGYKVKIQLKYKDMDQAQTMEQIQKKFNVNSIYAKSVFALANKKDVLIDSARIINNRPKPFVKWVGGKRQLLKQFRDLDLYPPHGFDPINAIYFEPFVGGGAVFFDLLPQKACLSDLNRDLITTYNVIKSNVEDLIISLKNHQTDKDYFLEIRSKDTETMSDIEIASRFIYLNRTCFNGMYRVNSKGKFNVPFGKYTNPLICDENNLRKVSESLQGVEIEYKDYKDVLKKAKKGDFIYFDPPYYPLNKTSSFTSYTSEGFLEKEQIELKNTFLRLHKRGCYVMLSNSNSEFINRIYSEIEDDKIKIHKVSASRAINSKASGRGRIKEVVITNY